MNFLKRAWYAVIRKPSRTIILLIIFFTVANLVLTGIAIQNATTAASNNAKASIPSTLTLSFDMQKAMQQAQSTASTDSASGGDNYRRFNITRVPITETMATTIAAQKNILDYDIIVNTVAMAKGFSPIVTSSTSSSTSSTSSQSNNKFGSQGQNQRVNFTPPDVTVIGVSSSDLYDDFNNGTATLNTGDGSRALTLADKGKHNVLIEKDLAAQNNLKVGSKITLFAQNSTTDITYTVVGIYTGSTQNQAQQGGGGFQDQPFSEIFNRIYTDYDSALEIKTNAEAAAASSSSSSSTTDGGRMMFQMSSPGIDSVVYYIDDAKNIDTAQADILKIKSIDWTKFSITSDDATYQAMVGPINQVAKFAMLVVYLVAIVGAAILALILLLNVRERMYETGVLLSMGEAKIKVVLQFVAEMVVIAAVAFSASVFSGGYIAQQVGNYLVKNQIATDQNNAASQQQNGGFGRFGGGGARSFALGNMRLTGGVNRNVKPISSLDVNINLLEVGELFLAGLIIILLATIIPAISITRYNPKSILTRAG